MNGIVYVIIGVLVGAVVCGACMYVILQREKGRCAAMQKDLENAQTQLQKNADNGEKLRVAELENVQLKTTIETERQHAAASMEQLRKGFEETKREQESKWKEQMDALRNEFKVIAEEFVKSNTDEMSKLNKEKLDQILTPLTKDLKDFRERVDVVHKDNTEARATLKTELDNMRELNRQMSEDTVNLTKALKGDAKVQGDWGELTLRRMLESVGLVENINFKMQHTERNDDYDLVRPDCIVHLPEDRDVIIDAKTSLTAYVAYTEAKDKDALKRCAKEHLKSVKKHIDELGDQDYSKDFAKSLPYVVMFIPNEAAYTLALNEAMDESVELWDYALKKKVFMTSTTNLLGILYMISTLWQRFKQEQNTQKIVEAGNALYEKMATFVENYMKMGNQIATVKKTYDEAMGQLRDGNGNLMGRFENLRKLGLNPKKQLPEKVKS